MSTPVVLSAQMVGNLPTAIANENNFKAHLGPGNTPPPKSAPNYQACLQSFMASPLTGATSMVDILRVQTNYNPLDPNAANSYADFNNWMGLIGQNSIFDIDYQDSVQIGGENNWQAYLDQLLTVYVGVSQADLTRIYQNVVSLVNKALSDSGHPETMQMVQNAMQLSAGNAVSTYFYYTDIEIIYHEGDKNESSKLGTYFTVYRNKFDLNTNNWNTQGQQVLNTKVELTQDWVNSMNNNGSNTNRLSCFQQVPSLSNAQHVGDVNDYWNCFMWNEIPENAQKQWEVLGWNKTNWYGPTRTHPSSLNTPWVQLSESENSAATTLGYNQLSWDSPSVTEAIESTNMNEYWHKYAWNSMTPILKTLWSDLGWNEGNWTVENKPSSASTPWINLNQSEQKTAYLLGYSKTTWEIK